MAASAFVAAALQVYWVHMVGAVQAAHPGVETFGRTADATTCPCCGSAPVASITHGSGTSLGQRYLVCSLCSAQWHMVRIQCSHCESTEGIAYQSLDLADGNVVASAYDERGAHTNARHAAQAAILAETCDTCGRYLKILHTDRDPALDPVADDVASLTLDLLVAQSGKHRHGVNLMLLFGEGEPEPDTPKPGVA